ncbi:MAG: DUF5052 family protein [Ruminococcus sp.]|nr:DUF5052 family protein [Ruminococcus sp.]
MKAKKLISLVLCGAMAVTLSGCELDELVEMGAIESAVQDDTVEMSYEAIMYDNSGNKYATFTGSKFTIKPNRTGVWGYNTNGSWTKWYETSSVVSIEIDGSSIQSCGSTVIFKDSRLEIEPFQGMIEGSGGASQTDSSVGVPNEIVQDYLSLKLWWYDLHENGQGGAKVVLIQSQDGYNIGAVEGDDVTWEVAEKLPKTTLITVDGMPLYIH